MAPPQNKFCELGAHAKFRTLDEKREEEKKPLIVATTFCLQFPRAAHAIRSDEQNTTLSRQVSLSQATNKANCRHTTMVPFKLALNGCSNRYVLPQPRPGHFISIFSVLTPVDSEAILRKIRNIKIIKIIMINVENP